MKEQSKTDHYRRENFNEEGIDDVDHVNTSGSPPPSCIQTFSDDKMSLEEELGSSIDKEFHQGLAEPLLPAQVTSTQSSVETETLKLFSNLLLSAHLETAVKENNINVELMIRVKDVLDQQYKTISDLKVKLNQRETAIKHLEEIVLLLQKSMELKCLYYNQRLLDENSIEIPIDRIDNLERQLFILKEKISEHFREDEQIGEMMNLLQMQLVGQNKIIDENAKEKKELNEVISRLQVQLMESNEVISALSRSLARQQLVRIGEKTSYFQKNTAIMDRMLQMKKKISDLESKLAEAVDSKGGNDEDTINDLKCILEDMQAKMLEKNNTNLTLVRSVKYQSETIAYLRSEIKNLQDKIDSIQGEIENVECI
jgi:hypothetical protein